MDHVTVVEVHSFKTGGSLSENKLDLFREAHEEEKEWRMCIKRTCKKGWKRPTLALVEGNTTLETCIEKQDFQSPTLGCQGRACVDQYPCPKAFSVRSNGWGVVSAGRSPATSKIMDQNVGVTGMVFMLSDPDIVPQKSRLNSAGEESDASISGSDSGVSSPTVRDKNGDEESKDEERGEEEREDEGEMKEVDEGDQYLPTDEEASGSKRNANTIDISGSYVESRGVWCRVVKEDPSETPHLRNVLLSDPPKRTANICNRSKGLNGRHVALEWRIIPPISSFLPPPRPHPRPCLDTDHEDGNADFDRSSTPTSFSSAYTVTENGGSTTDSADLEEVGPMSPRPPEESDLGNFENNSLGDPEGKPRPTTAADADCVVVSSNEKEDSRDNNDYTTLNPEPRSKERESTSAPDATCGLRHHEAKTKEDKTLDLSVDLLHCCTSNSHDHEDLRIPRTCRNKATKVAVEDASDAESLIHVYIPCRDQKEKESEEVWVAIEATYERRGEDPIPDPSEGVRHSPAPFLPTAAFPYRTHPRGGQKRTRKMTHRHTNEEDKRNDVIATAATSLWDKSRPQLPLHRSLSSPVDSSSPFSSSILSSTSSTAAAACARDLNVAVWSERAWSADLCVDRSLCITSLMCAAVASSPPPPALSQQGPRRHYSTRQRANEPDALSVQIVNQEPKYNTWDPNMGSIKELLASAPNLPTKSSTTNLPTKRFSFIIRSNSVKSNNSSEGDTEEKEIHGRVTDLECLKDGAVTPSDQAILEKIQELNLKQSQDTLPKLKPRAPSRHPPCRRCGDPVYPAERFEPSMGMPFHVSCFKCSICNVRLTLKTYFRSPLDARDLRVYCRSHVPSLDPGKVGTLRSEPTSRTSSPDSLCKESAASLGKLVAGCLIPPPRPAEEVVVKCDTIGLRYF